MNSRRSGFTLIELMITMVIMVILVAVAIVSLRGTQVNGRDAKRSSDIDIIARGLENRYQNGMAQPEDGTTIKYSCSFNQDISSIPGLSQGSYPSSQEILYVNGSNDTSFCPNQVSGYLLLDLDGVQQSNLTAPSGGAFVVASSASVPSKSTVGDNYYYQPLQDDGSFCSSILVPCRSFNLYYVSEADGILHTIRSKHQ